MRSVLNSYKRNCAFVCFAWIFSILALQKMLLLLEDKYSFEGIRKIDASISPKNLVPLDTSTMINVKKELMICRNFSDSSNFVWLKRSECYKNKFCNVEDNNKEFRDTDGKMGRDKMSLIGKNCKIRRLNSTDFSSCSSKKEFNVVNIGGSVARAHFVSLCELLQDPLTFSEDQKHKPSSCKSLNGINVYHMFLPGIYTTPKQSKEEFDDYVKNKKKYKCNLHRIWDKSVSYNETALPKLKSMLEGSYSPWHDFDIRNADLVFWSSGVWDVAFKQDLSEYKQNLVLVAEYLRNLKNTKIVFRTIPRFKYLSRARECNWKETVELVTPYNKITKHVQQKFGFDLIDVESIPRDDEIYDGIHFSRKQFSAGLTGECDRAVSNMFANYIFMRLRC